MHFGEPLDDERLAALLRPDERHRHGHHRRRLRRRRGRRAPRPRARRPRPRQLPRRRRDRPRLLHGRARGGEGLPALHRPAPARPGRLRRLHPDGDGARRSSASAPARSISCSCTTPTAPATRARSVWEAMRAVRDEGLARAIGVAPGPANGFTLDVIDCFERFGELIEWAMVILNPLEPWPGELVLPAAREHGVEAHHARGRLRRPVLGRRPARARVRAARPSRLPARRLGRGRPRAPRADAPGRRAPRPHDAPARRPVEPRARAGRGASPRR